MNTFFKLALTPLLAAGACAGMTGAAIAAPQQTTINASICKPSGDSATAGLFSMPQGVTNNAGVALSVVCPVVRTWPAPAAGYSVVVDGSPNGEITCVLSSYNNKGTPLGSIGKALVNGSATLTLAQAVVPAGSSQTILCRLPNKASLYDIEPVAP